MLGAFLLGCLPKGPWKEVGSTSPERFILLLGVDASSAWLLVLFFFESRLAFVLWGKFFFSQIST